MKCQKQRDWDCWKADVLWIQWMKQRSQRAGIGFSAHGTERDERTKKTFKYFIFWSVQAWKYCKIFVKFLRNLSIGLNCLSKKKYFPLKIRTRLLEKFLCTDVGPTGQDPQSECIMSTSVKSDFSTSVFSQFCYLFFESRTL